MFYFVEPEVGGGLGDSTVIDASCHPPIVSSLEYRFEGWLGDELLESFPCFIVTKSLARKMLEKKISGFSLDRVLITVSDEFREVNPNILLPEFLWLKIGGSPGVDDLGLSLDNRLVISQKAKGVFESGQLHHADFEDFE
jgi:hypothetical protein